jgi:hypothetical protein
VPSDHSGEALLVLFLVLYMLPAIVAYKRKHRQRMPITVLNLLVGWTAIGWLVAIVWACTADVEPEEPGVRRFRLPWWPDERVSKCGASSKHSPVVYLGLLLCARRTLRDGISQGILRIDHPPIWPRILDAGAISYPPVARPTEH